jgi:hypothetical protein
MLLFTMSPILLSALVNYKAGSWGRSFQGHPIRATYRNSQLVRESKHLAITRLHNLEDRNNLHCLENLKFHLEITSVFCLNTERF